MTPEQHAREAADEIIKLLFPALGTYWRTARGKKLATIILRHMPDPTEREQHLVERINNLRDALGSVITRDQNDMPTDRDGPFDWRQCAQKHRSIAKKAMDEDMKEHPDGTEGPCLVG